MATMDDKPVLACEIDQGPLPDHEVKSFKWAVAFAVVLAALSLFRLLLTWGRLRIRTSSVAEPDIQELFGMVQAEQGAEALKYVALVAEQRGGWAPAPGDVIVYEPDLRPVRRAAMMCVDDLPPRCTEPRLIYTQGIDVKACIEEYQAAERQLRFGPSTFSNPVGDGDRVPRETLDDVLATYIEEVGHSWQEYLYETEGQGQGPRTRPTSVEAKRR